MACCPTVGVTSCKPAQVTKCGQDTVRDCATLVDVVCADLLSVFICNSNAVTDDKFSLWLDGTYIGDYDVGNEARATIILPASATGKTINGLTGRGCTVFDYYYSTVLDTFATRRSFKMRLEQIKGFGNFGLVQFLCTSQDLTTVTLASTPGGSFTYGSPTPFVVGTVVDYGLSISAT
jgi:hypothetical protein